MASVLDQPLCKEQACLLQESRLNAQDAVREDEGKWIEQERKLMERRVKHQVQVIPYQHSVCHCRCLPAGPLVNISKALVSFSKHRESVCYCLPACQRLQTILAQLQ